MVAQAVAPLHHLRRAINLGLLVRRGLHRRGLLPRVLGGPFLAGAAAHRRGCQSAVAPALGTAGLERGGVFLHVAPHVEGRQVRVALEQRRGDHGGLQYRRRDGDLASTRHLVWDSVRLHDFVRRGLGGALAHRSHFGSSRSQHREQTPFKPGPLSTNSQAWASATARTSWSTRSSRCRRPTFQCRFARRGRWAGSAICRTSGTVSWRCRSTKSPTCRAIWICGLRSTSTSITRGNSAAAPRTLSERPSTMPS
mmetsp:Transcript_40214/g.104113  ORF Transcript_40214/g.104113 Transcript_40214/m.104113 type:complete len:253 (-) Transcript_40214:938-1696(-)